MIIKEKPIKNYAALEGVLRYILSKEVEQGFVHTKHILGDRKHAKALLENNMDEQSQSILSEQRLQNMLMKYIQNDKGRIHKRQNGTKFHHSILSFHRRDAISAEDLLKVAKVFIKQRYPKSLVCAVSHHDKEHCHIHLLGSHVQLSGVTNYHTKQQFSEIKQYMERWQEQELDLNYSSVQHVKKKTNP